MADGDFDVLILGAGSGGYACALRAAQLGLSVGLVEKGNLGGTCLHVGCIPTKALLHAAEVADPTRESAQFGVQATLEGIDMAGVNAYKDGVVSRLFKGLTGLIKGRGITVIEGEGRLTGPRQVDGRRHDVRRQARGAGLRLLQPIAARSRDRRRAGHHLRARAAAGAGAGVGDRARWRRHRLRVRQRVASFGAEVTIVEALPRLVAAEDEASSKALERAFRKRKIQFRTGTPFQSVKRTDAGVARDRRGRRRDRGRAPARRRRPRPVDRRARLRRAGRRDGPRLRARPTSAAAPTSRASTPSATSSPACSSPTAASSRASSWPRTSPGSTRAPIDEAGIPRVTYCDPEVASVGLDEAAAARAYGDDAVETLTYDLGGNGKSQILRPRAS